MKFKIRLVTTPGDKTVNRAQVRVADATGAFMEGSVILEGETIETEVSLAEGQTIEITELVRPVVYDTDQKAAVPADLTPDDKLAKRATPPTEAAPKTEPHTKRDDAAPRTRY